MSYLGLNARYSSEKHCFVHIARSLLHAQLHLDSKVHVFKATFQNDQTAFFSCHFKLSEYQDNELHINGLYANKLGIREKDEIILEPIRNVPLCESVFVDPLSVNDWEILEKNSSFIENHLLDQVRVVWEGQVLPVWVQQSVCLFLKIRRIRPLGECVLLQQQTEVIVARYTSLVHTESKMTEHAPATPTPSLFKKSKKLVVNEMAPLDVSQSLSLYSGLFQYLQSFFMWSNTQPESQHAELVCRKGDFSPDTVSLTLRVQGFSERWDMFKNIQDSCQNNSLKPKHFLKNSGLVFVNICDVNGQCNLLKSIPRVFFAKMVKLRSPRELHGAKPEPVSKRHSSSSEDPNQLSNIVQVCLVGTHEMICEEDSSLTSFLNENNVLTGHVMVPNPLRLVHQLEVTSKVELQGIRAHRVKLRYLYILPLRVTLFGLQESLQRLDEKTVRKAFEQWIMKATCITRPMIVFDRKLIKFRIKKKTDYWVEALLSFNQSNHSPKTEEEFIYVELHPDALKSIHLVIQLEPEATASQIQKIHPNLLLHTEIDPRVDTVKLNTIRGLQEQSTKAMQYFRMVLSTTGCTSISQSRPSLGMLLITGATGTGKTIFASSICKELLEPPILAYPIIVACKSLVGKKLSSVHAILEQQFEEAMWRQPSVIVLDDLDCLCSKDSDMDIDPLENVRLTSVICDFLKKINALHPRVAVMATSESTTTLHQKLMTSRGMHYIQMVLNISHPDQKTREEILQGLLETNLAVNPNSIKEVDLKKIACKAEGFVVQDLKKLVNRAIHAHLQFKQSDLSETGCKLQLDMSELMLQQRDFDAAFVGFSPLSLRGIELHNSETQGWSDVGGLEEVKSLLMETFVWPAKYPELFNKCPIRIRTGILLFGAPGTGKTLLVAALVKECHMNFITVKGPELLNKYVGASEQAVRDTFNRARKAKPCVYVLGATSRPDLIDPALLRPGRLDKCLYCDIPNKEERLAILKVLTAKMHLDDDVSLECFAEMCNYFTGADLKALLYNAQLVAIHEKIGDTNKMENNYSDQYFKVRQSSRDITDKSGKMNVTYIPNLETGCTPISSTLEEKVEKEVTRKEKRTKNRRESLMPPAETVEVITVNHSHILKACSKMKPSVSASEQNKYDVIYKDFKKSREANFNPQTPTLKQEYLLA
ncbi:PEX1 [Acanthosepion pharaonis]|uniref:Peroxisomal ATPase PEX1 n=1 Tax=Acanthosepion pharaonis TaxID=158019 RepID=A0A812CDT2_ACAPH|nr:PEX1 [Sepia pharaonis]